VTTTTATAVATATSRSDVLVRPARPDDAASVALIHHRGWTESYRSLVPDAYLDSLSYDAGLARWTSAFVDGSPESVLVADLGAQVVGFVGVGPTTDPDATAAGEVWDLWVDPAYRSQGVGALLLDAGLALLARRHPAALVWVLEANTRGRAFYARQGAVRDGLQRSTDVPGGTLVEVRLLWGLAERRTHDTGPRR